MRYNREKKKQGKGKIDRWTIAALAEKGMIKERTREQRIVRVLRLKAGNRSLRRPGL